MTLVLMEMRSTQDARDSLLSLVVSSMTLALLRQGAANKSDDGYHVQESHQHEIGGALGTAFFVKHEIGIGVWQVLKTSHRGD